MAQRGTRRRPLKFFYATQTATRPPTFVLFCTEPEAVQPAYRRFLENRLRETFDLEGTPVRLRLRARSEGRVALSGLDTLRPPRGRGRTARGDPEMAKHPTHAGETLDELQSAADRLGAFLQANLRAVALGIALLLVIAAAVSLVLNSRRKRRERGLHRAGRRPRGLPRGHGRARRARSRCRSWPIPRPRSGSATSTWRATRRSPTRTRAR